MTPDPLVLKEIRGTLRTRRFFWAYFGTLILLGLLFLFASLEAAGGQQAPERIGHTLFQICVFALAGAVVLVMPAFSCTALAGEREMKSFDLLVTTRMTPWQIVRGKFLAAMLYAGLFIIGSLPLIQIAFLFGGVSVGEILVAFAAILLLAAVLTSVALGISAPFRGTRWPTVLGYTACLALGCFAIFPIGVLWEESRRGAFLPVNQAAHLMLWIPLAVAASVSTFALVMAIRSVKPVSDNRAAALRIFFPCFQILAVGMAFRSFDLFGVSQYAHLQQAGYAAVMLISAALLVPWILVFACEAPLRSRRMEALAAKRARIPFARFLLPGSAPGAAWCMLTGFLLLTGTALSLLWLMPLMTLRDAGEGLALCLSLTGFLCGTGFLLSTAFRPGTARALLFAWLGVASSFPVCVQYLRPEAVIRTADGIAMKVSGYKLSPPAWTLPATSPVLAAVSWMEGMDTRAEHPTQWRTAGLPLHQAAVWCYALAGALAALWGRRRLERLKAKEVR